MTGPEQPQRWALRLYVSGASTKSMAAVDNLRRLCDEELPGQVDIEVVDVQRRPALVIEDQVVGAPTLIKRLPPPLRRLIGDLSDPDQVRQGLDLGQVDGHNEAQP